MCARLEQGKKIKKPGDVVNFTPANSQRSRPGRWGCPHGQRGMPPFARSETLQEKWLARGWSVGSLATDRIAERANTGELRWSSKPVCVKVVYTRSNRGCQLAVVTRQATMREQQFFGHHRVPVVVH